MENNFTSIIQQAGLTKAESRVYGVLLQLQSATVTQIAAQADVKRSSVYNVIDRLEVLGLVSKLPVGKRTYYSAVHPRRLLQLAKFKYQQVEDNLPKLLGAYEGAGEKPKIQMFEGIGAVREIYREAFDRLKKGEELLIFTNIGQVIKKFPEVPQEFKKIVGSVIHKSKARELVSGNEAGREYAKDIFPKTKPGSYEVRLAPKDLAFGENEQFIFSDKIIYFALQKHIFVTVIENADLAKTHRVMFEMAWSAAEVPVA